MSCPGEGWFCGQGGGNRRFVRGMIGFTDITGVAEINVAAVVAAGGPSHFVGPFPFREPMPHSAICRCNLLCKPM